MAIKDKIAVIGSGLGGLSAAIRLAHKGFEVHVYEQSACPGGKAGSITAGGYRFDTGPSVLTMTFVLEDLFKEVGENIQDYVNIKPLEIICKYFYADGTVLNAYSDFGKFAREIDNETGENARTLGQYFEYCKRIYELTSEMFLFNSFAEPSAYLSSAALKTLFSIMKIDSFRTMHEANSAFFSDKRVIQLFDRYATYSGSSPYLAPATLNIIPHVEYTLGSFFVKEGIYSIPGSIAKAAEKKGVTFHFNSAVEKILCERRSVKGLRVNGEDISCSTVISNSDVYYTYNNLLNDGSSYFARQYKKQEPSSSALVYYWGIKACHEFMEAHNILFSSDYREEFEHIFNKQICPADPTIYIHISSKYKHDDAPDNSENWFVMINAPHNNGIQNWENEKRRMKEIIINKINKVLGVNISTAIDYEKVMTPKDIETNTNSFKGSIYGISSNSRLAAFIRQSNRSRKYKGLYFTGGSAHPGGGIPLVLLSGKIVSRLISGRREND